MAILNTLADWQTNIGKTISKIGGITSYVPGAPADIRIGGGGGLGAAIAQGTTPARATPYFSTASASTTPSYNYSDAYSPAQPYSPTQPTSGGGGGGQVKGATTDVPYQGGESGGGGPSEMDMINQAYEQEQGYLGGLEGSAKSQAASSKGIISSEGAELESQTAAERGLRETELAGRKTEAGLDAQTATTRVKQMLSDLINRGNSYLAAIPGFSSSTAPAYAEKIGRTAMSQAGGIQTELQKSVNAINLEGEKVGQFYDNKLKEIQMNVQRAHQTIESQLQQQLNNIGGMRAESARAKAQATMSAWQNYANQRAELNMQAFSLTQTLAQWAMEKGQSLQQAQEFALQNTPQLNPSAFGIRPPDQPVASGLGQPATLGGSGIQVSARGADEETQRNLAMGVMPSTVMS